MDTPTPDASQDARYAPPDVAVADVGVFPPGLQPATRGERFTAVFIDGLLQLGLVWLISVITPFNPFAGAENKGVFSINWANTLMGIVLFLLLNGYLLATQGQTIGKRLLKIRIARASGEAVSLERLALRYGVGLLTALIPLINGLYGLVDALLIFRDSKRCLHDDIADTMVFKNEAAR